MDKIYAGILTDIIKFDPDLGRFNHLLMVTGYADFIAAGEQMDAGQHKVLHTAALLHDIGIRKSLEKYGSSAGKYQQIEGPDIALSILQPYGFSDREVTRVCFLIAHHHEYGEIEGLDYQILVEADFMVNCNSGQYGKEKIRTVRDNIFSTASGKSLLQSLYHL